MYAAPTQNGLFPCRGGIHAAPQCISSRWGDGMEIPNSEFRNQGNAVQAFPSHLAPHHPSLAG